MNDRQRRFADLVFQGRPAGRAYEEAGYDSKGGAADSCATKLLRNAQIVEYIDSLRKKSTSGTVKTAQDVKEGLSRLMDRAEADEDHTGFVALANRLAKMDGHDQPDKVQHSVEENTLKDLIRGQRNG